MEKKFLRGTKFVSHFFCPLIFINNHKLSKRNEFLIERSFKVKRAVK